MIITIVTTCWVGEFDQSEFPHYTSHTQLGSNVTVIETIELDNERQFIQIEA